MERLTAEDRLMLWSDDAWPQDVGVLAVLDGSTLFGDDGRFRIEAARDAIERQLHLLPRFRQVLSEPRRGLGWPLWVDDPGFDLRDHVRVADLPDSADEAQLLQVIAQLRAHRLDRSRPLWEMWFLPGLPESRVGLFIRLHHVVADGIAGVAALGSLLDPVPDAATGPAPPWTPAPWPTERELLVDNLHRRAAALGRGLRVITHPAATVRHVRAGWPAMRELLGGEPGPRTSLDRLVGPSRTLALLRTRLELVTEIAHAHGATVNDVLLAVTAAGLRGLLRGRGESVEDLTLPIYVPVSLRRDRSRPGTGNLISQMVVPLPLWITDPSARLRQIAAATAQRKTAARPSLGTVFRSRIVAGLMLKRIARHRVNVETADLPGPPAPLYFAGARLLEVFPMVNLVGNVSLGVGALSYAGQFTVMAIGDADAYPDIEVFTAVARDELHALAGRRAAIELT